MKLTILCLFLSFVQLIANDGFSQSTRLTLNLKDARVEDVLMKIEEQSNLYFIYNRNVVDVNRIVNVSCTNQKVSEILNGIFSGTDVAYQMQDRHIILKSNSEQISQPKTVSGKVTDSSGSPLPGVSVVVKGTTNGTITDANGNYSLLNVPKTGVLQFSFVGMKRQEVAVAGNVTVNVILKEEAISIDEVVAIGYGSMKKSDVTGSVVRANMEIFEESPNINLLESLHGSIPGLNVGAVNSSGENPSLSIRGSTNFSGDDMPLIVLDGIIYRGNLNDINPNDIESVDVLKDASSASIYGSEAANGVILVTTKKSGGKDKPIINYSASYSTQVPSKVISPMDAKGNIQSIADDYWTSSRLAPDYLEQNPNFDPTIYFKTNDYRKGYEKFLEDDKETNWWDLLTDNAYIQDHNLSVSGSSKTFNYFLSGGFVDQNGVIENDNYKRYSFRVNVSSDITDWLNLGINTFISTSDYSGASVSQRELFEYFPLLSPYNDNGDLIVMPDGLRLNPLKISQIDDLEKRNNQFTIFHSDIKLPFLKGFNYRLNYSINNQINKHYQFDPWGYNLLGEGFKNYENYNNWTLDHILSYERSFDFHKVNLTFVYGAEERKADMTYTTARNFTTKILGYNALELGNATQFSVSSNAWEETSLYSMARGIYTFKDKYILTGTMRRDGFSGFGNGNKFGIFPSAALAWIISQEDFMKSQEDWLNYLKFRISYGTTARRALTRYQTLAKVSSETSYVFGQSSTPVIGKWLNSMANPNLKWETTTGINLGIDYALLNSRITGNVEYYNNNTKGIIYDVSLPEMTGFSSISTNIGKIHNYGIETSINGKIIKQKDFSWDATVSFSLNRNKIVSIVGADNNGDGREDDIISDALFIGEPLNVIYGFVNDGMWQLADQKAGIIPTGFYPGTYKVKDLSGEGEVTYDKDRRILGYKDPSYRVSLANSIVYKKFSLKFFINGVQGGKKYFFSDDNDPQKYWGGGGDNWDNRNKAKFDYWLPENPDAKYHRPDRSSNFNQLKLAQRNFFRLQDLSLSYRFNNSILKRYYINNLKVFVSGKNLLTWAPQWDGWDPETGQGVNPNGTPVLKNYSIGLNIAL